MDIGPIIFLRQKLSTMQMEPKSRLLNDSYRDNVRLCIFTNITILFFPILFTFLSVCACFILIYGSIQINSFSRFGLWQASKESEILAETTD